MESVLMQKPKMRRIVKEEKNVNWELVEDFKKGLEQLKKGQVIEC
jgi:hypothetical protein